MLGMKTMTDWCTIVWSEEASVDAGRYGVLSAFQRDSYVARVEFKDGRVVVVVLPLGAARQPAHEWAGPVVDFLDSQTGTLISGAVLVMLP